MKPGKSSSKRRKIVRIVLITVLALAIIVFSLPYLLLHLANKNLASMNGYYGHIQDIDVSLLRGGYTLDSMYLDKRDSATQIQTPFFSAPTIELSIEWKSLLHGSLVGELVFEHPEVTFTKDKVEPAAVLNDSSSLRKLLNDFMPLRINRFQVNDGTIRYKDEGTKPPVNIKMTNTFIVGENLRNSYDSTALLPARVKANALLYKGTFGFTMKFNPMAVFPAFDLNTEIKNVELRKLNEFFQAYAKLDVNRGVFGMYAEAAAKDGKFIGYVKPLIEDLDVVGKEDRDDNILRKMWEGIAGGVAQLLTNKKSDRLATKIPFEGNVKDPDANVWLAIGNALKNAFVHAIKPAVENEINIASVTEVKEKKGFFQRLFGKKKKEKKAGG